MKKGWFIATAALFLAALATVLVLIFTGGEPDSVTEKSGEINLPSITHLSVNTENALHKSSLGGIYYSVSDENGQVTFYQKNDEGFIALPESGKKNITATVSGQKINFDVTYLTVDGKTEGYGLFTNSGESGVMFYDYFFVKLRELPASHQIDEGDMLLLLDENSEDFSNDEKTYEQSFYYNLETEKITRFTDEATDSTDLEGKKRSDFAIFTDSFLDTAGQSIPFFTSRYYSVTDENKDTDINLKNRAVYPRHIQKAHFMYGKQTDKGTLFLRKSESGFKSILYDGNAETTVFEFGGDYYTEYIRSGDYVFGLNDGALTSLETGARHTLQNPGIADIKYFSVSPDGSRVILAGAPKDMSKGTQMIAFYDLAESCVRYAYGEGLYTSSNAGFYFDSDELVFARPSSEAGSVYTFMSFKWKAIFEAETVVIPAE